MTLVSCSRQVAIAIAVAATCFVPSANGAIHYYFGDFSVPQGFDQPVDLNFENDDFDDVVMENFVFDGVNYQGLTIPYAPGKVVGFAQAGVQYVSALSVGAPINAATLGPSHYGAFAYGALYPAAQFNSAVDAFVGLAFAVAPTGLNYAWARVSVNNAAGTLYVKDWAFEDQPGVGIAAGATGALPIYGDLNGDRNVDGGDLLAWQRGYPVGYTVFDFWKWQDNYGAGAGLSASAAAAGVPEPTTAALLAATAVACRALRRLAHPLRDSLQKRGRVAAITLGGLRGRSSCRNPAGVSPRSRAARCGPVGSQPRGRTRVAAMSVARTVARAAVGGSGTEPVAASATKDCRCQIKKSAPSTVPSPLASP